MAFCALNDDRRLGLAGDPAAALRVAGQIGRMVAKMHDAQVRREGILCMNITYIFEDIRLTSLLPTVRAAEFPR